MGGGLGSRWIHKGRRPHPCPLSPAGQARSDLGPVCLSSPSTHPCPASALGNSQQPHGPQPQAKLTPKQEEVISLPAELQLRLSSSRVFCPTGHSWARWEERDAASRENEVGSGPRGIRAVLSSSAAGLRSSWGHPGSTMRARVQHALRAAPVPTPASSPGQDSAQRRSCSPKAGPRAACHSALLPGWSL